MKRTPRNYDGIFSPTKTIGELLTGFFQKKNTESIEEFIEAWPEIIGPKMAPLTQVRSFSDGVLTVIVRSSTLYSLLCQHEQPGLLKKLKERFGQQRVKNVIFKVG